MRTLLCLFAILTATEVYAFGFAFTQQDVLKEINVEKSSSDIIPTPNRAAKHPGNSFVYEVWGIGAGGSGGRGGAGAAYGSNSTLTSTYGMRGGAPGGGGSGYGGSAGDNNMSGSPSYFTRGTITINIGAAVLNSAGESTSVSVSGSEVIWSGGAKGDDGTSGSPGQDYVDPTHAGKGGNGGSGCVGGGGGGGGSALGGNNNAYAGNGGNGGAGRSSSYDGGGGGGGSSYHLDTYYGGGGSGGSGNPNGGSGYERFIYCCWTYDPAAPGGTGGVSASSGNGGNGGAADRDSADAPIYGRGGTACFGASGWQNPTTLTWYGSGGQGTAGLNGNGGTTKPNGGMGTGGFVKIRYYVWN